ncbi:inactive pancreatic lipase-related protein 1-like [Oppia nitens]|uniref:inactive pancreatic lipase-related protein 1-like n=1 Tax=Oppia nitens TaxID=1686743 RepID=UPI0023DC7555|nr:inactive pancreatic lipase-related protein 1-like [Oppia nitens]
MKLLSLGKLLYILSLILLVLLLSCIWTAHVVLSDDSPGSGGAADGETTTTGADAATGAPTTTTTGATTSDNGIGGVLAGTFKKLPFKLPFLNKNGSVQAQEAIKSGNKNAKHYKQYNDEVDKLYTDMFKDNNNTNNNNNNNNNSIGHLATIGKKGSKKKSNLWSNVPLLRNILGETCYDNIGCFSALEYQDFSKRPIPLLPMSPDAINPTFHLYTVDSMLVAENFSYNSTDDQLKKSGFKPQLKTIFITHGFRCEFEPWMIELRDFIFKSTNEYNVIVVVWKNGAMVPLYHLAATNTRVVGAMIAYFAKSLARTFDFPHDRYWLIGHSLGGQTVGYAGKLIRNPPVSRITGLDPAGPGFHYDDINMHLDRSDGQFVDVIHTDSAYAFNEGMGTEKKRGFYDFYPNGGLMQPGCSLSRGILHIINSIKTGQELSCSHTRGTILPYSIGNKDTYCQPIAYDCENYELFIEGRCNQCRNGMCQPMGLNFDYYKNFTPPPESADYKFWIQTNYKSEFCVYHYQIAMHIAEDSNTIRGFLEFNLKTKDKNEYKFIRHISRSAIGEVLTLLITFQFKLDLEYLTLTWHPLQNDTNLFKKMRIMVIEVNYMSHIVESERLKNSYKLCPRSVGPKDLTLKTPLTLEPCKSVPYVDHWASEQKPELLTSLTDSHMIKYTDYECTNKPEPRLTDRPKVSNKFLFGLKGTDPDTNNLADFS